MCMRLSYTYIYTIYTYIYIELYVYIYIDVCGTWGHRCRSQDAKNLTPPHSLLQQPGPKKFELSKIERICKAKKLKVPRSLSKPKPIAPPHTG